ncbi:MAG: hypothetical protein L0Y71_00810 [Gemmataceae bacterium]|nr:hypothetical protein [Gemmataceae bacterium]
MAADDTFTGHWFTTFGVMDLEQAGQHVHGAYHWNGVDSVIDGRVKKGKLEFTYTEPKAQGEGWFTLARPGKFTGQWRAEGDDVWRPWIGERGFDGLWDSSFGMLRLFDEGRRITGCYEGLGSATIEGRARDGRLEFRYQEPNAAGDARFTLAADGRSFEGEWKQDGTAAWQPWVGRRLSQTPGQSWLVVLEAHWQRHLLDKEYSFGDMLKAFFARVPGVQFSHRFFSNEAGLRQWCRDLMYVPDPVVVLIASHGTTAGLAVRGETIDPRALADTLRLADTVQLLHFSACLTMQDNSLMRELSRHVHFPISGYTTAVDWAASAILEFTYLDLILARGMAPADAAEQLTRLLSFAGDKGFAGSVYPAAGFRLLSPR